MQILTKIINDHSISLIDVIINNNESDTENDFNNFSKIWKQFYLDKKKFYFKIDTTDLTKPNLSYCYRLAMLIKEFKVCDTQYLQFSIMTIPNSFIRSLLYMILNIERPIATVYVTKNTDEMNSLYKYKLENSILLDSYLLINNINVIES